MSLQTDISLGLKKETVFGTAVAPDHFPEITEESLVWQPNFVQGQGFRVGSVVPRSSRRALASQLAGGGFGCELATRGMGILFEAALGAGVSTIIPASTAYQQLFTPAVDDFPPSYTIQKALPLLGGARSAITFDGAMANSLELTAALNEIAKVAVDWVARSVRTDFALAVPSYPASVELLTFIHGAITVGGSVALPTTTALASGGTALANIRDFSVKVENNYDGNGMNFGSAGKLSRRKAYGERKVSGQFTAEYTSNDMRDAYLSQTPLALTFTLQSLIPLTAGVYPTVQVVIPDIRLEGDLPTANGGDVIATQVGYTGMDGQVAASPIYVAVRTADTAI